MDKRQREANQRLLEALLTEELGQAKTTGRHRADAAGSPSSRSSRSWTRWLQAAAVLLGAGVVVLTSSLDRQRAETSQDPVEWVEPEDVAEYLQLLAEATSARLVYTEVIGAGKDQLPDGTTVDRLDRIRWLETASIAGPVFEQWRAALQRCSGDIEKGSGVATAYDLELALPGGRVVRSFTNVDGPRSQIWITPSHAVSPDAGLQALLDAACADIVEQRRVSTGQVDDADQLLALPDASRRLDVSAELAAGRDLAALLPGLQELTLRGNPNVETWRAVAALQQLQRLEVVGAELHADAIASICALRELRALTLRECAAEQTRGRTQSNPLRDLGALLSLETLHLVDATTDAISWDLTQLASLPSLQEFGLRSTRPLSAAQLDAVGHTKIERLLLAEPEIAGDLSELQHLPSLRDLVLVADLDDQQLLPLAKITSLRRLTIRNASAEGTFVARVLDANPGCDIDWTKDARWIRADYAFRYVERAWHAQR